MLGVTTLTVTDKLVQSVCCPRMHVHESYDPGKVARYAPRWLHYART